MKVLLFLISTVVPNISVAAFAIEGCAELKERNAATGNDDTLQSPPDQAFWIKVRDAYVESVGQDESTIDWTPSSSKNDSGTEHLSGFMIPIEVKITPGKGRSVHTKHFVPKGTPVWGSKYFALFHSERSQEQFETFLTKLTWEESCDVLQWCFAWIDDDYDGDDGPIVACSLDENSLMNHGELGESNIAYDHELHVDVALRDIQAGEELTEDYNEYDEDLEWFDNLARKAWGDKTWSQASSGTTEL